ncbi:unnamed protein product [Rhizopus stolonifer]
MNKDKTQALNDWLNDNLRKCDLLNKFPDEESRYKLEERLRSRLTPQTLPAVAQFLLTLNKVHTNEPLDRIIKRQRNTDAARRSRLRKAQKLETIENKVHNLKLNNGRLRVQVAVLESDINHIAQKEQRDRQRVLELETQLASVHQRLLHKD